MGEVPLHPLGLRSATETLAPGHHVGGPFQSIAVEEEGPSVFLLLLMGDTAPGSVQHIPRTLVSYPLSAPHGLSLRLHRRCQHLHVHLRRHEVVHRVQIRTVPVYVVSVRCVVRYALQCGHRKLGRYVGAVREEIQVLCC